MSTGDDVVSPALATDPVSPGGHSAKGGDATSSGEYVTAGEALLVEDATAAIICKSSSYERETVEEDVINWAKCGKRNRALANILGGTACYFFYSDISDWV